MGEPRIRVSAILRWQASILLCRHEKNGREHWLRLWLEWSGLLCGWAQAELGSPERGLARMLEGLGRWRMVGLRARRFEFHKRSQFVIGVRNGNAVCINDSKTAFL